MSLLDSASLIVTPNGYKEGKLYSVIPSDGSGDLSVTRATTATRVNSAGLVELVPYNLIPYSQEFSNSSFWSYYVSSVSANTTTAPDGTNTADTIAITGTNGSTYQSVNGLNASVYTISAYFKKTNEDNVYIDLNTSSGYGIGYFNLSTLVASVGAGAFNPQIESVGNGWYRCSFQLFASGNGGYGFGVYAGAGQSAYIWGAQLNEGTLKPYQKTETRLNIPRLDYSNGTCPSILVEPQRTNLQTYSSSFDNSDWAKVDSASIIANDTISPDGTLTADRLTPANASSYIVNATNVFSISNNTYSHSVYAKAGTQSAFGLAIGTPIGSWSANFDLSSVTANVVTGSGTIATIEDAGNGWYRCILTAPIPVVVYAEAQIRFNSATGYIYIWGAQLEVGSYATSYIPTTSASVTRNADVISKTGISSLIGQTEGTIFWDVDFQVVANNDAIFIKENATFDTFVFMQKESSGIIACGYYGSGALQARIESSAVPTGRYKIAFAYKNNDFVMYLNGTQVGTDTSGTVSGLMDYFDLHWTESGCNNINAAALWKTRLTNTQLAQLTTI